MVSGNFVSRKEIGYALRILLFYDNYLVLHKECNLIQAQVNRPLTRGRFFLLLSFIRPLGRKNRELREESIDRSFFTGC